MTPKEIAESEWAGDAWRPALADLVLRALTVAPQSTAQLFSRLGISGDRELAGKLRTRLHHIKRTYLAGQWRYSGKYGKFKTGDGERVQLVEWFLSKNGG